MQVEYGPVSVEIERWNWPCESVFSQWKVDFLSLEEAKFFDIYVLGGFLEVLSGKRDSTPDVDIIITGCDDLAKIENLIVKGTRLGIERYQVFFDVLWFDNLPIYADDLTLKKVKTYLVSNQWIIDGKVHKSYPDAKQLRKNIWEIERTFPTLKQRERIDQGYQYCRPVKFSEKEIHTAEQPDWIKKIKFEPINYLVKSLIDTPDLLDHKPVIAGGFIVALYAELIKLDSSSDWSLLVERIAENGFDAVSTKFNDIDFYFTETNSIIGPAKDGILDENETSLSDSDHFGLKLRQPYRRCNWAKTYLKTHSTGTVPFQFIKKIYVSPAEVIKNFDLLTSSIAWHDDNVYVIDDFEEVFYSKTVRSNKHAFHKYISRDVYSRLFNAKRSYKYADRLGFYLSDELLQFCNDLYDETMEINLSDSTPLLDKLGNKSTNPVPSSSAFKNVLKVFYSERNKYHNKQKIENSG